MKPKAQTLQMKLGFFDEDFKKPKHDELMIWLDKNKVNILNDIFDSNYFDSLYKNAEREFNIIKNNTMADLKISYDKEKNEDKQFDYHCLIQEFSKLEFKQICPVRAERFRTASCTWEVPVKTGYDNKYIVGFIDCVIAFRKPHYCFSPVHSSLQINDKDVFKHSVGDVKCNIESWPCDICVEVKTEIKSVGELIRQIRHYQEYIKDEDFYVLCPNNQYKDILREQGIGSINFNKILED